MAKKYRHKGGGSALRIPGLGCLSPREKKQVLKRLQDVDIDTLQQSQGGLDLLRNLLTQEIEEVRRARRFFG